MPKKRNVPIIPLAARMHIFCEGEKTEPEYISRYIRKFHAGSLKQSLVIIEPTKKNTPVQLVEAAIAFRRRERCPAEDEFWVVFDREAVGKYDDALHAKAFAKAAANKINIAISNVCFELWLLLHFRPVTAAYSCFDNLISTSTLKRELANLGLANYEKGNGALFGLIHGRVATARANAQVMNNRTIQAAPPGISEPYRLNPYCDVHLLLDAIDSF